MTTIREVIAALVVMEEALPSITSPREARIKRVYPYLPPSNNAIETPCIMHQYRLVSEQRRVNEQRYRTYHVRIQFLFAAMPTDTDVWSEVAAAFDEVFITAMDAHVKLNTLATSVYQRHLNEGSQDYMPAVGEWNGNPYVASQYEYEVQIHDTATMAA